MSNQSTKILGDIEVLLSFELQLKFESFCLNKQKEICFTKKTKNRRFSFEMINFC